MLLVGALISSAANAQTWTSVAAGGSCSSTTIQVPITPDEANCPTGTAPDLGTDDVIYSNWDDADCWTRFGGATVDPGFSIGGGDTVIIKHNMFYNVGADLTNAGTLHIVGGAAGGIARPSLFIPGSVAIPGAGNVGSQRSMSSSGTFRIFNARYDHWRNTDGCATVNSGNKGSGKTTNDGGIVHAVGARIETVQDWESTDSGGSRIHKDSCLFTGQDYSTIGTDELINVCATIAGHGSGNFDMGASTSDITFDDFELKIFGTSGNVSFQGRVDERIVGGGITGITAIFAGGNWSTVDNTLSNRKTGGGSATSGIFVGQWWMGGVGSINDSGNVLNEPAETNPLPFDPDPFPCVGCNGGSPLLSITAACDENFTSLPGTLTASAEGGFDIEAYTYLWSPAAGLSNPTGLVTTAPPGTYTITVTDAVNNSAVSISVTIHDNEGDPCNSVPTAVTIGEVNLEYIKVSDYLSGLEASDMTASQLFNLLTTWDPAAAANLAGDSKPVILAALISYLDPDGDGNVALFSWETLEQRGTVGFYVDRLTSNSESVRINETLLPAIIPAPLGGEYLLADPGATPGRTYEYTLTELEAWGSTKTYGPFSVVIH